jgi:hypothetical protein
VESPTLLTSVQGEFRARVLEARLASEGIPADLKGAIGGPYGLTVGDLARVDVYVDARDVDDASLSLLADEADAAVDLEWKPARTRWPVWLAVGALAVTAVVPIARAAHLA